MQLDEIQPCPEHVHIRKTADEPLTKKEQEQYESIVGGLQWIARICRLDILVNVSKLQQFKKLAKVSTMNMCNKIVKYVKQDPSIGLTFQSGKLDWDGDMCIGSVTDASHADELDELSGEGYRSQGGRITMLATMGLLKGDSCYVHPIGCQAIP